MMYYVNNDKLISSNISISDPSFTEITKEVYESRIALAENSREKGVKIDMNIESEVEIW